MIWLACFICASLVSPQAWAHWAGTMSAPLEMGAAVPLQRQKSLQSSILFMQEEHAKTLKALHSEIQHLQKKCSELTFSVAMGTTSSPQEGRFMSFRHQTCVCTYYVHM